MIKFVVLLFLCTSAILFADDADNASVYVNSSFITKFYIYSVKELNLKVNKSDTISIILWTDTGRQVNATIEVLDSTGTQITTLHPVTDNKFPKTFIITNIDDRWYQHQIRFIVHYNKDIPNEKREILHLVLEPK
ncbi:MAG: hypothetical protein JNJ85_16115 [Candidatus Kapabacteria bacterium]|nr:hypothetical protein [Candidatus Kapabacteria bacterium]